MSTSFIKCYDLDEKCYKLIPHRNEISNMYTELNSILKMNLLGDFNIQGLRFVIYDTNRTDRMHKSILGYYLYNLDGTLLFNGEDFCASPLHSVDSYKTFMSLLSFLTLRPGDTDREYFDDYSKDQIDFANSSFCEQIQCDLSMLENNVDMNDEIIPENFFINWQND